MASELAMTGGAPITGDGLRVAVSACNERAAVEASVADLLARMRTGDREAAGLFLVRYGPLIRRRIRGKLSAAMRRVFDSQDILSTVGRRLDRYIRLGQLAASSEPQLWALVGKMAEAAVVDKARVFRRLSAVEAEDAPFAMRLRSRLDDAARRSPEGVEDELASAIGLITDPVDREILSLWLHGTPHTVIAEQVELSPDAVRQRWRTIRLRLAERMGARND